MPLAQHPVASPFGHRSEALEVVKGLNLAGKTALVTGGASGLGVETVRALAQAGARVIMPVRNRKAGEEAAVELRAATRNNAIETSEMDLGDFASVRSFAKSFVAKKIPLDIIINNAGIMATPERRINGRLESQFATNHLGHMLMVGHLSPALAKGARVVALSSIGHRISPVRFDDPHFEKQPYDKWVAYGQAKTANALYAVELNRRIEPIGMRAYSVHPGGIRTNLQRDLTDAEMRAFGWIDDQGRVNERFKTPAGGAATAVWCATSPLLAAGGGVYCEDCNVAKQVPADHKEFDGIRPWAMDGEAAKRLWALSEELLGETFGS